MSESLKSQRVRSPALVWETCQSQYSLGLPTYTSPSLRHFWSRSLDPVADGSLLAHFFKKRQAEIQILTAHFHDDIQNLTLLGKKMRLLTWLGQRPFLVVPENPWGLDLSRDSSHPRVFLALPPKNIRYDAIANT